METFKINGVVRIDNSGNGFLGVVTATDANITGVLTASEVDAKVSAKAITEQTEGGVSDVSGADEILLLDIETGNLLRVSVDEFVVGAGIGTLLTNVDNLTVTGVTTVATLKGTAGGPVSIGASLVPSQTGVWDLGAPDKEWRHMYISSGTIYIGGVPLTQSGGDTLVFNENPVVTSDPSGSLSIGGSVTAQTFFGDGSAITGVGTGATGPGYTTGFYDPSTGIVTFGSTTHPYLNFHTNDVRGATGATGVQGPIGNAVDYWDNSSNSITVSGNDGFLYTNDVGFNTTTKYLNLSHIDNTGGGNNREAWIEANLNAGSTLYARQESDTNREYSYTIAVRSNIMDNVGDDEQHYNFFLYNGTQVGSSSSTISILTNVGLSTDQVTWYVWFASEIDWYEPGTGEFVSSNPFSHPEREFFLLNETSHTGQDQVGFLTSIINNATIASPVDIYYKGASIDNQYKMPVVGGYHWETEGYIGLMGVGENVIGTAKLLVVI